MSSPDTDKVFSGSIPALYDTYLVPLIFEPYAADLVNRLASGPLIRVLELAAGTGVVTRALASALPESVAVAATDLNQSMLDHASALGTRRPVEWHQADAMQLLFQDGTFDAVICQFGVMFFPDKSKAFSEARRVLRSGGIFMFSVWDRIGENEFADVARLRAATVMTRGGAMNPPRTRSRSMPSHTARGRLYETRSRHGTPRGSSKQPTRWRRRLPSASGVRRWTVRSRRTSSPSKRDSRELSGLPLGA